MSREGGEGVLLDPRRRLVEAEMLLMRVVWPQGAEWGSRRAAVSCCKSFQCVKP